MPYFITTRTKSGSRAFEDAETARFFIAILQYFKYLFSYKVYAYVVMPDHVHFIIELAARTAVPLKKVLNEIKGNFSRRYNQKNNTSGSFWQKGYYDRIIRNEHDFKKTLDYIHNNAVKAGLVTTPSEYEFSSYNQWIREEKSSLIDRILL